MNVCAMKCESVTCVQCVSVQCSVCCDGCLHPDSRLESSSIINIYSTLQATTHHPNGKGTAGARCD